MVSSLKRAAVVLAGAGALAVGVPAAADAATDGAPDSALPVAKATQLQRQAARSGHYPAGPRRSVHGLKRSAQTRAKRTAARPHGAKRIRVNSARAKRLFAAKRTGKVTAHSSLFGYEGDFFAKRNTVLSYVQGYYQALVPQSGGTFVPPALYEVNDGTYVDCGGVEEFSQNASYCFGPNFVVWSIELSTNLWSNIGDTAWATVLAHEYGHGAQAWLGYGSSGYFGYELYREAFADCMAGAWLQSIYARGLADGVGRGDGQEFHDLFQTITANTAETRYDNHGTFEWRYQAAIYGWNYGWNGCVSYGNWIADH